MLRRNRRCVAVPIIIRAVVVPWASITASSYGAMESATHSSA
jgi:hypothetical protein